MNDRARVVVFTCNWSGYSGLEAAGGARLGFPASVFPLRVTCLGRLSSGVILKAFEKGAAGVLLLGCPPGECHYQFGNHRAEEVLAEARQLAGLLGYRSEQLKLDWVDAGDGEAFVTKVRDFIAGLNGK